MRWFRDTPIRQKLTLVILLGSGAAVTVACLAFVITEVVTFRQAMVGELAILADLLANNSTAALSFNDPAATTETLAALKAEPHVVAACVYRKDGTAFASYTRPADGHAIPSRPDRDGHRFDREHLTLFRPVLLDNKRIGTIYVQADLERMYARLRLDGLIGLLVLVASLGLILLLSSRLQQVISKPILALADTAGVISHRKDYSVRAPQQGQDEIGLLTGAFNRMLTSIQESESALRQANQALVAEIAERKHAQEQLTALNTTLEQRVTDRTREAVEANRAKSEFLANMSHELRTPLNSVIGFANLLLKNKNQSLREEDLAFLDRIVANGKHLLLLINQILDLSKIEARRTELELSAVPLETLLRETVAELEAQASSKGLRLVTELPPALAPIRTDAAKLKQVLINLIGNALKFTEKGRVTVRVTAQPPDNRPARIEVIDTGIGVRHDRLGVIFDAFQQADAGTTRKYGGTGLGLTISRALCQLMGYRIEVTSRVGHGSIFSVLLAPPVAVSTPPAAPEPAPDGSGAGADADDTVSLVVPEPRNGFRDKVVLVIDDEPDARMLLTRLIEDCGCRVLTASSGTQGLRLARAAAPDLITLDLLMPRMDGWQVLRTIKADLALTGIPVVVISIAAHENRGTVFGTLEVLQKPVTREELAPVLKRNLPAAGGKVLVVDDEADARRLLSTYLAEEVVQIQTAANGREAAELLERFAPDLIILDLIMPEMDGMAFLQRLRGDPRFRRLPVVVVTAKELNPEETRRLGAHAQVMLQKAEDLERELKQVLGDLLGRDPRKAQGRPLGTVPPPDHPEQP